MAAKPPPRDYDAAEEYQAAGSSATSWCPRTQLSLASATQLFLDYYDAENECEHGWLPHETDRFEASGCSCWTRHFKVSRRGAATMVWQRPPLRKAEVVELPKRKPKRKRKAA